MDQKTHKIKCGGPKDWAARQAKYRASQAELGRRGRLYYLTDSEKLAVDAFVLSLRNNAS